MKPKACGHSAALRSVLHVVGSTEPRPAAQTGGGTAQLCGQDFRISSYIARSHAKWEVQTAPTSL